MPLKGGQARGQARDKTTKVTRADEPRRATRAVRATSGHAHSTPSSRETPEVSAGDTGRHLRAIAAFVFQAAVRATSGHARRTRIVVRGTGRDLLVGFCIRGGAYFVFCVPNGRAGDFRPFGHTPATRMEIRTWRSAIADQRTSPPGAPSTVLGRGTPGWVWRCDAAISRYKEKTCLFGRFFHVQPKISKWRHFR